MDLDLETELEASEQNEFTGARRESNDPPGFDEPICLISYEITVILLGAGPGSRSSFWKSYRRELALNQQTDYANYHVNLCRHLLLSPQMNLDQPVYFRGNRLTTERELDAASRSELASPRFN